MVHPLDRSPSLPGALAFCFPNSQRFCVCCTFAALLHRNQGEKHEYFKKLEASDILSWRSCKVGGWHGNCLYRAAVFFTVASPILYLQVKYNYPPSGMKASSDPEVEVSQLDVDQAHQPQGALRRLQPLYAATEYFCPLQYPRVVSVYPAMLIARHCRSERETEWMLFLMSKCLPRNVYI